MFIDELNRTKPELQNKLFPIIYDKRVQGTSLTKLKYRWAAMNPPSNEEDDDNDLSYIGASPLDPALADRFTYIIEVPTWDDLKEKDKQSLLHDNHLGRHEFPVDIHTLIRETQDCYKKILKDNEEIFSKYIITLLDLLKNSFGYFSSRRAALLEDSLLYLYAASKVLNDRFSLETSFSSVAYLHIQNTLPNTANNKIDKVLLINICNQALKLSSLGYSIEKEILLISDPIKRLKTLIKNKNVLDLNIINDTIPHSLGEISDGKIRRMMALFTYLAFRNKGSIHAAVMETLAVEVRPILESKVHSSMERLEFKKYANTVIALMNEIGNTHIIRNRYLNNYLCSFLPDQYTAEDEPKKLLTLFLSIWEELNL